jgi:isopentenyl diphosphate isomerase/L-lactate dehydrogenase-like FMN-dependent dehydrogenase
MSTSDYSIASSSFAVAVAAASAAVASLSLAVSLSTISRLRRSQSADTDPDFQVLRDAVPPKSIAEFERVALQKMAPISKMYFQYFSDPNTTISRARDFFNSLRLVPRILQGDLTDVDTSITIFGQRLDMPVLVAPSAFHVLACPEGEVATARGAGAAGAGYCYNFMLSSKPYQDVVQEDGTKWLHLYMFKERELVEAAVRSAFQNDGTEQFSAIILTCDHPHQRVQGRMIPYFMNGKFPFSKLDDFFFPNQPFVWNDVTTLGQLLDPVHMQKMAEQGSANPGGTNSYTLDWDEVKWIQNIVNSKTAMEKRNSTKKIPIVAKGILSAEDARMAMEVGVDAIVVSNHGGRQCDFSISAIEVLPVIMSVVKGQIPVFVDSGVRTSADILRALCLGASGVLLGRPPLWALTCEGSSGLERMLTFLKEDLKDDMRSLGVNSISQLGMKHFWPPDQDRIRAIIKSCREKA